MNKIVVDWKFPTALVIVWCVAIFFGGVAWLYAHENAKEMYMLTAAFFGLFLLSAYSLSQKPKVTEIDVQDGVVTQRYRSFFGISKVKRYSLKSFRSIRSYFTAGRNTINVVELIAKGGRESVQIANFDPGSKDNGFFSSPKFTEAEDAEHLRKDIAAKCSLVDDGFVGVEWLALKKMSE